MKVVMGMSEDRAARSRWSFKAGKVMGFGLSLAAFTSAFYFILSILGRIPPGLQYLHVLMMSLAMYCIGVVVWKVKKGL